jgi:hypothetical protein
MKLAYHVVILAALALATPPASSVASAACKNCKGPAASRTVVKTNYKYRTVQKVKNVTKYRDVKKVKDVYLVRNVVMTRVITVKHVAKYQGMKRVSKAEYMRLQSTKKKCNC